MRRRSHDQLREDATCRLAAVVELMEHDINSSPALTLSIEGHLGLQRILRDCVEDLDQLRSEEPAQPGGKEVRDAS